MSFFKPKQLQKLRFSFLHLVKCIANTNNVSANVISFEEVIKGVLFVWTLKLYQYHDLR